VLALADQLLTLGAMVDVQNAQDETPLVLACLCAVARPSGGLCAKLLVDHGCDCNLARADGRTASQIVNDLAAKEFTLNEYQVHVRVRAGSTNTRGGADLRSKPYP